MGKKKREHVVFDQMLKQKKSIPFSIVNREDFKKQKRKAMKGAKVNEFISFELAFEDKTNVLKCTYI